MVKSHFLFCCVTLVFINVVFCETGSWVLSGGAGERTFGPQQNSEVLTIIADRDSPKATHWKKVFPLKTGGFYKLTCEIKKNTGSSDGRATIGTSFSNTAVAPWYDWTFFEHIFKVPSSEDMTEIRLGQWKLNGSFDYRNWSIEEIFPVHKNFNGIELGSGEYIKGNVYWSDLAFNSAGNYARIIDESTAYFNTYRWDLHLGSYLVISHDLKSIVMMESDAKITINVNYLRGSGGIVQVSRDKQKWINIGNIKQAGELEFDLPDNVLPTDRLYVRFKAANIFSRIQISRYYFKCLIDKKMSIEGKTEFAKIVENATRFAVRLVSVGDFKPATQDTIKVLIENNFWSPKKFDVIVGEVKKRIAVNGGGTKLVSILVENNSVDSIERFIVVRETASLETFKTHVNHETPYLDKDNYGYFIKSVNGKRLWWTDGARKSSKTRRVPTTQKDLIEIKSAKNEYENFQLAINPQANEKNVSVNVSDFFDEFGNQIASENIALHKVEYVPVKIPTDSYGTAGYWPDPLPPLKNSFTCAKKENTFIWVTVFVPPKTSAGRYAGEIFLNFENDKVSIPVELVVWDFALPKTQSVKTAFGFQPNEVRTFHHLENEADYKKVIERYWEFFAKYRISPYDPFVWGNIKADFDFENLSVDLDFSEFDKNADKFFNDLGFSSFRLNVKGLGAGSTNHYRKGSLGPYNEWSEQYTVLFQEYLTKVALHLREKGWDDKAYIYWYDEPNPKDYELIKQANELIKKVAPNIDVLLTEEAVSELYGAVDIWCPYTPGFDPEIANKRKIFGEKFWWYLCTFPTEPYCTLFIDHNALELRTWLWQSWQYGVKGVLCWQSNYWDPSTSPSSIKQNPYLDAMSYGRNVGSEKHNVVYWGNGDGRFMYPPPNVFEDNSPNIDGPVSSIRLENLRDGLEDYEYFKILNDLLLQKKDVIPDNLYNQAIVLLEVPTKVSASMTRFSQVPEPIFEHRERLAEMIEKLSSF